MEIYKTSVYNFFFLFKIEKKLQKTKLNGFKAKNIESSKTLEEHPELPQR